MAYKMAGKSCHYCGGKAESKDHRIPIARGGDNHPLNLVPSCKECNNLKGQRTPGEFLEALQALLKSDAPRDERLKPKARIILSRLAPDTLP